MSERGSFVTEYIYCKQCCEMMWRTFCHHLEDPVRTRRIVGGFIGGLYNGEELHAMEAILTSVGPQLCHAVRVIVLADSDQAMFIVQPGIPPRVQQFEMTPIAEECSPGQIPGPPPEPCEWANQSMADDVDVPHIEPTEGET